MRGSKRSHPWLLFVGWLFLASAVQAADAPHAELEVKIVPERRMLYVTGSLTLSHRESHEVVLHEDSDVHRFTVNDRPIRAGRIQAGKRSILRWLIHPQSIGPAQFEFAYTLPLRSLDTTIDHRAVLGANVAAIGPAGAFVPASAAWYPALPDGLATHRIVILTPKDWRAVVSGRLVEDAQTDAGHRIVFESQRPLPGIDLMAGPYTVAERNIVLDGNRNVRVRTYFHPELQDLAEGYLDSASRYIERYDRLIGAYAHPAYSIVSSPLPTGFGMPGIAYLGRQVIRLPFIRGTSLGHEVLHDWWGNGVYPDDARGNWSEGLTTFMADYAYREDEGAEAAKLMREGWLRDYAAVPPEQDRPLRSFVSRRHGADQAVGYNKTAFVFYMLRDQIGAAAFAEGLRAFWRRHNGTVASWDDLRTSFEQASGAELQAFFDQWVERAGAPTIDVESVRKLSDAGGQRRIEVRLRQAAPVYRLRVPLRIELDDARSIDVIVDMADASRRVMVDLPVPARFVVLDPQAHVFRRVDAAETAPTLRPIMLDPRTRVVLGRDPQGRAAALKLAAATLESGARAAPIDGLDQRTPVFVVALSAEVPDLLRRLGLPAVPESIADILSAFAYAGRSGPRTFAVVSAPDPGALLALTRSLPHLGGQSYAVFEGGRSVRRGVWPAAGRRVAVD